MSDGVPKVRLGLSDLITRLYRASGLSSLAELARALQVDQSYVVRMLKPVDEGGRLPSVGLLTRLADVCGRNEAERRRYRTLLHQAKLSGRYPDLLPPVAREAVPPLSLPTRFCRRLAKDLEAESLAQQRAVAKACKTSLRQIWNVTRGKALMSPWQVTRAAVTLAQEPGNYLRLAGYVPRGLQRVLEQDGGSLEDLSRLSPRAFNELAQKGLGMPHASVVASRTAKGAPRRRTS
ncbi:MAG: helix-turn-helix transcriptional regulator [Nitrospirota bacterium]